jgi:hypothetical protein
MYVVGVWCVYCDVVYEIVVWGVGEGGGGEGEIDISWSIIMCHIYLFCIVCGEKKIIMVMC